MRCAEGIKSRGGENVNNNQVKESNSKESKELALHYMQTLVDVARESFLILDSDMRIISANPIFYQNFQVTRAQTEGKLLYELGNGQWNIPELRDLMEKILPEKKIVKNFIVTHVFETIGKKTMQLNAKRIDTVQLIILAMEDITVRENLEEKLAQFAKDQAAKIAEQTKELSDRIKELEDANKSMVGRELKMVELKKEIKELKKRLGNGNGKNGNRKNGNGNHRNG